MMAASKILTAIAVLGGAAVVCPLCLTGNAATVTTARVATVVQVADTATARLHISGMTCGTCPVTARLALRRVPGVYEAVVTLPDSLGVVRYDSVRVSAREIAAQLTKMTGYGARVLSDTSKSTPRSRRG